MDLSQLQVLKIIHEEGSFSKASEKLKKAKSALTYAISNLEDELGLHLVDRSGYRPQLTKYGLQLLEKSLPLIESFTELEKSAFSLSKNQELKIKISMVALFPLGRLTKALKELDQKFKETEVVFTTEVLSGEKLLLKKEVDISIIAGVENKVDLEFQKICDVGMPLVISSNHPLFEIKNITKEDLAKYPQIVVRSTYPDERSFGVMKEAKKWYVDDLNTKLGLILEGLGWGRLPEHMVNEYIQRQCLEVINIKELSHDNIEIYLARRKNEYHGIVSNYLWNNLELLRDQAN